MVTEDITFLRIEHFSAHYEVEKAASLLIDHITSNQKFLKDRRSWMSSAHKLIASLWMREKALFRFSTKKDYFSSGGRQHVWMTAKTLKLFRAMLELKWIEKSVDETTFKYSKKSRGGLTTIYSKSDKFKDLLENLSIEDIEVDDELPWAELKDREGNLLELPVNYQLSHSYRRIAQVLKQSYTQLTNKKITIRSGDGEFPVDPVMLRYRRKWVGNAGIGGGFYSSFCNLPKQDRLSIKIDGEAVGSWDFSQLHPTLLLLLDNSAHEECSLFATDDIYEMPEYPNLPRLANRLFINTILNSHSREAAARSIGAAHEHWDLIEDKWVIRSYMDSEIKRGIPIWPQQPLKAAHKYIDAFLFRHPTFHKIAFKGLWGKVELLDSSIIEETIHRSTALNIPVLPALAELIVPVVSKAVVHKILIDSFHEVTQYKFQQYKPKLHWSVF